MEGAKLSGLWKNKDKNGKTYLSGSAGLAKFLVLPNDFKKEEKDPDFYLWAVPPKDKARPRPEADSPSDDLF